MNAKLVLCLSIVGILSPSALAIIAGFNADIHMDIPGAVANDFHIEGTLKSGFIGGNWNRPATIPGTVMSSSNSSQRRAYPLTSTWTRASCASVAPAKIRNRSAGKPTIRPS